MSGGWQKLKLSHERLNHSAVGDALGCACLGLTGYVLFVIAGCLQ